MPDFFQINQLTCGYRGGFTLQDINFMVRNGSFTGIIGPNGSGKTTLFKGISGELTPTQGNIILNRTNISHMSIKERAQHMAIVTQNLEALDVTVEDYVLMGRLPYRKRFQFFENQRDYDLAYKYMKQTDIYHLKDKPMAQLSGGEQQLADIARALTQEPDLLLLDEPTAHLDITHQVQILNLIQRLNYELNLTVLMIIHDLNLAGEYCDYLIMLNHGQIHTQGTPEEVLHYKNIEAVYDTVVITQNNPVSNKPAIFLVSNKVLANNTRKYNQETEGPHQSNA